MKRSWIGVALAVVGFLSASARGQMQMPEPAPVGHGPLNAVAGPLAPEAAPPGPGPDYALPESIPGAFTDCPPAPESGFWFHAGTQGWKRQKLGSGDLVFIDNDNRTRMDTGAIPRSSRFLVPVMSYNDVDMSMAFGFSGSMGWIWDNVALELCGFYIPQTSNSAEIHRQGRLLVPFSNAPGPFTMVNGLWLQADLVRTTYQSNLGDLEMNWRWWNRGVGWFEPFIGVRYVDLYERVNIFTDDQGRSMRNIDGRADPRFQASYTSRASDRIVAPQLGFEANCRVCSWLTVGAYAKGAWGVNFADLEQTLIRGDGLQGPFREHNLVQFSQVYEGGLFADIYMLERLRIRGGYSLLALVNVPEAVDQINFNLTDLQHSQSTNGSILYHGPMIQLQFLF